MYLVVSFRCRDNKISKMAPKSSDQRESNENISVLPTSINYADPDLEIDEQFPPPGPSSYKSGGDLSKVYFSSLVNLATSGFYTLFGLLKYSILRPYIIFWRKYLTLLFLTCSYTMVTTITKNCDSLGCLIQLHS